MSHAPRPRKPIVSDNKRETITQQHKGNRLQDGAFSGPIQPRNARPMAGKLGRIGEVDLKLLNVLEVIYGDMFEEDIAT
jgi:CRISPR/Cas system-associated endoribonuclease Cas2